MRKRVTLVLCALLALAAGAALAEEKPFVTLATTTSTHDSGLLDAILPQFTAQSGIEVRVVSVGTGRALEIGRAGDADILLVHDRASEDAFVSEGHAPRRADVMYNDFLLVGPGGDPAATKGNDIEAAFQRIADRKAKFVSRGDDSGTHKAEKRYWAAAARDPKSGSGAWYLEAGGGMATTLGMAGEMQAYTLTDRSTWLSLPDRRGLEEWVSGDARLLNRYGVMVVSAAKHPGVKEALAEKLASWLTSEGGRAAITGFRIGGQQVFFLE
jgi:tungstate transport system substrate-binding protein